MTSPSLKQIYLDYNATTPCYPEVLQAMLPYFTNMFGNASSNSHAYGWLAQDAYERALESISDNLGVSKREVVFTSGATESINQVLKGLFYKSIPRKNHIITVRTEHKAVLDVCNYLEKHGAEVTYLDTNSDGLIKLELLQDTIRANTLVVCVLLANNETGVIQPLEQIAAICKEKNAILFSDASQALGKIPLTDFFQKVDCACFSAHKIYGPKGVGMTYISENLQSKIDTFIQGGGQQRGLRGGTYNIPGIMGMAKAVEIGLSNINQESLRLKKLRNRLEEGLSLIPYTRINGKGAPRLPNTLNISFEEVDGTSLLRQLSHKLAVSNGSACNSSTELPSHVLVAMDIDEDLAFASLRFSLGKYTKCEDIDQTIQYVQEEVHKLRIGSL